MKTKWHLYIMWSVLSLGILSYAQDTYESPFTRKETHFKQHKSKSIKHLTTGERESSHRLPAITSPMSLLTSRSMGPEAKLQSDFAYLPKASVTCSTSDFVLRVKPAFFGQGADAEELRLGNGCKSNGVLRPYGDLLFTYPLTACGAVRESTPGYLLYKFTLHYEPSPKRFPTTAQRIDVGIECRYQRIHHVHKLTVQPTWEAAVMRKNLKGDSNDFQLELMDVVVHSCMLDSKSDPGASRFISRTDKTLRFSIKAFQFTADPDSEVNIHCKLLVSSEDPGPAHKSCTYKTNSWKALTGKDSICDCCDSQCVPSKLQRAMMEGFASSGSLLVSDQPYAEDDGFLPVGISRDSQATIHNTNKLHTQETPLETEDVVTYDDDDDDDDDGGYNEEPNQADGEIEKEEERFEEDEEESGFILGVMPEAEPDSDELGFRERASVESKVMDLHQLKEDGSGFVVREEEEEFIGKDETHLNPEEAEVLRHWEQLDEIFLSQVVPHGESQLPASDGEEQESKQTGRDEEHERMMEEEWEDDDSLEDLLDDSEMTWYFKWR
ncbi:zona pellucida sperm-binding protein 3 isoform X2 [Eleginops maclovinus]|uniref:zona pellucida sperm-binding protein 3 isoform X2 n=1 Tax=Eleginops maclovinus TaxID=56733 RepID=UPI00307FF190